MELEDNDYNSEIVLASKLSLVKQLFLKSCENYIQQ